MVSLVEMAGIEPASERFSHRTSTSVVDLCVTESGKTNRPSISQVVQTRESSFVQVTTSCTALRLCDVYSTSGQRAGQVNVTYLEVILLLAFTD